MKQFNFFESAAILAFPVVLCLTIVQFSWWQAFKGIVDPQFSPNDFADQK